LVRGNIFLDSVAVVAGHADAMKQAGDKSMQLLSHGATPKNLSTKLTEDEQQQGGIPNKKIKWVKSMLKQAREYDALYGLEMEKMIKTDLVGPNSIKARVGLNRLMCSASGSRLFLTCRALV